MNILELGRVHYQDILILKSMIVRHTISKLLFTTCIQIGQYVAMAKFILSAICI